MSSSKQEMRMERVRWDEWEGFGRRQFFLKFLKLLDASRAGKLTSVQSSKGLSRHLYDLIRHGINGTLKLDNVLEAIARLIVHDEIPSLITDILNLFDDAEPKTGDKTIVMRRLCKSLEPVMSKKLFLERLEWCVLEDNNLVIPRIFYAKFIKLKTKLFYKQNKFNLYREESEGYAKLISELNQGVRGQISCEDLLKNVVGLVGCFSLDPTRVIDAVLDSFEANLKLTHFYCRLISNFVSNRDLLTEVIGFRYLSNMRHGIHSKSLSMIVAILVQKKMLRSEDILPWLGPSDDIMLKEIACLVRDDCQSSKCTVVSIKDSDESLTQDSEPEGTTINQKLELCEVFLQLGDWYGFKSIINHFPTIYVMRHFPIAKAVCDMLHYIIDPLYKRVSGLGRYIEREEREYKYTQYTPKQVTCFCGLKDTVFPILFDLGGSLHFDQVLLFKIVRICTFTKVNDKSKSSRDSEEEFDCEQWNEDLWYDIISVIDSTLLPALCYMEANCCAAEAIWSLVKLYPLQDRYSLYSNWNDYIHKHQALIQKSVRIGASIKSCMKRVSKENVKQVGRIIGKLSHNIPGPLFEYIILQVQMYDNLIAPVVDSLKYLNCLSYDVLGFSIVDSLTDNIKKKYEGNAVATWFQSTASFCAAVFKKYNIELSGLLHYLIYQLRRNESLDLLILKELVNKMAGVEVTDDMTNHQLEALSGGELLRSEAGYFVQPRNTKRSALRLKEALEEGKMIPTLAIMIAQERNIIGFQCLNQQDHLKLVGKLFDECHDTLLHFATFLSGPIMKDVNICYPSLVDILTRYDLSLDVVFLFLRPLIVRRATGEAETYRSNNGGKLVSELEFQTFYVGVLYNAVVACALHLSCLKFLEDVDDITKEVIALFWVLNLSDIYVPTDAYNFEIRKLNLQLQTCSPQKDHTHKPKKEVERLTSIIDKLSEESLRQYLHVKTVHSKLDWVKYNWFQSKCQKPAKNEIITFFLQLCIFPRIMMSTSDAIFCAKFIKLLHDLRTPNFSTLLCYDRLFCEMICTVASCTENEANRYGRFLHAVLEPVMRWHGNRDIYNMECACTPGFLTKFRGCNDSSEPNDNVNYENYRHVCHKWHYKLTKAFLLLLESKEYIQMRNAIIVLMRILPYFPVVNKLSGFLEKRIQKVKEEEKNTRPDLFALAASYSGQLTAKIPYMIDEGEFHSAYNDKEDTSDPTHDVDQYLTADIAKSSEDSYSCVSKHSNSRTSGYKSAKHTSESDAKTSPLQDHSFNDSERQYDGNQKHKVKGTTSKQSKKTHYSSKSEKRKSSSPRDSSPHASSDRENTAILISPRWKPPHSPSEHVSQSSSDEMPESKRSRKGMYNYEKQKSFEKERRYREVSVYSDDDKLSDVDSWGYDSYLPLSKDENVVKPGPSSSGISTVKKVSDDQKQRKVESPLRPPKSKSSSKQGERVLNEKDGDEPQAKKGRSSRKARQSEEKDRKERKIAKKRERLRASKSSAEAQKGRKESEKTKSKSFGSQSSEVDSSPEKKRTYTKEKESQSRERRSRDFCKGKW